MEASYPFSEWGEKKKQQVSPRIEVSPTRGNTALLNTNVHMNKVYQLRPFVCMSATIDPENGCSWNSLFPLAQYKPLF